MATKNRYNKEDIADSPNVQLSRPQQLLLCGAVFVYGVFALNALPPPRPPLLWSKPLNQLSAFIPQIAAACFMAQAPLLPYLLAQLGAESSYAAVSSTFSALQLLGSLVSGPLADAYGGRTLLIVSFGSSAVCYALTASASSLAGLYASRHGFCFGRQTCACMWDTSHL